MKCDFEWSVGALHLEGGIVNAIAIQYSTGICLWRIESSCTAFRRVFHGDGGILLHLETSGNKHFANSERISRDGSKETGQCH